MSEIREILHKDDALTVAVVIADETARVVLESKDDGPDLSVADEVIVIVDGQGRSLTIESERQVSATLVEALADQPEPLTLMVRVYEFFEGWDLFTEEE